MTQNSADAGEVLDVDALMNSRVEEKDVSADAPSISNSLALGPTAGLKQHINALPDLGTLGAVPNPTFSQNGDQGASSEVIDLTRPVKTEGEASPSGSTSVPATAVSNSSHPSLAQARSIPVANSTTEGLVNAMAGAFGPQLTTLGAQLHLTPEEQAAAYKKANIVALSALAKKGGPNAKDMLAVQAKLQEFLTSLITLAGKTGPQLKVTVQALVQKLVTGTISEEEFAVRIESDLHSQHQPSLLPFLKNSVPHLKTRLQLQQAIMKELLQRQAVERQLQQKQSPQPQHQQQGTLQQQASPQASVQLQPNQQLPQPHVTASQPVSQQQLQSRVIEPTVVSQSSTAPVQQQPRASTTVPSSQPSAMMTSVPSQPSAMTSLPSQLSTVTSLPSQLSTVTSLPSQLSTVTSLPSQLSTVTSLPSQLNQVLSRDQLAQLTAEQRLAYFRQVQLLKAKQMELQKQQQRMAPNATASADLQSRPPIPKVNASVTSVGQAMTLQAVLEKQQQLVKEQQGSLGRVSPQTVGNKLLAPTHMAPLGGLVARGGASNTQQTSAIGRTSFANLKVVPGGLAGRSSSPSNVVGQPHARGRPKGAKEKGKDALDAQDEDEDEEMDIAGVNLQEETAHFLPQSVGETSRTCKDEVFLSMPALKQRVATIGRRYGISEVSEDVLVLLSHATQERLRDCIEKLTAISHHRTEVLKDNSQYRVVSEARGQLKVLESIDRLNHKRKQEREKEKILRAAKSRSKAEDPEAAAKIKEQAKQLQLEEEQMIRNMAANATALAAIGSRRKRTSTVALQDGTAAGGGSPSAGTEAGTSGLLLTAPSTTRQPKRRITTRDLIFYMEQERETRKSPLLYKSLLK